LAAAICKQRSRTKRGNRRYGRRNRFAVDLDQDADFAAEVDVALDQTFLRRARGKFVEFAAQLLAEDRRGFGDIAVGLGESLFAVKKPGAGRAAGSSLTI